MIVKSVSDNVTPDMGVSSLVGPVFREDVVVYFKEMPSSLEEFASPYGVKLIFVKEDIKMAAFETVPVAESGRTSKSTQDFLDKVSKDSRVESAERDWVLFTDPSKNYMDRASMTVSVQSPESVKNIVKDEVIVGFWRMPPSLDEFAAKHGGKLIDNHGNDSGYDVLKFAAFKTDDMAGFIKNVSTDPYVRYVQPEQMGYGGISVNGSASF